MDHARKFPKIILAAGLLTVLTLYSMGWSGTLHFDDESNLGGLYGVSDWTSAVRFSLSGEAGPTGRPLARATFALQHEAWPDPRPFLIANTVLHLVNGLLCFLLAGGVFALVLDNRKATEWLALAVALIWTASPLLASANLMVVQRMTGLSGFFVLLSALIYLVARRNYQPTSLSSNLALAGIVGTGTLLAGLSKENGFLLPVFLLLIERLLVPSSSNRLIPLARPFLLIVLAFPALMIIGYLVYRGVLPAGYQFRDFTALERLMTQPVAIMDYMRQLVIPDPYAMTPFHDNFPASSGLWSPPSTVLALLAVLALLWLVWRFRHSQPLIAFGLFWFFAGHLAESTTIPLELYFPHRNYVPAIGFYLALAVLLYDFSQRIRLGDWIRFSAVGGYFLVFCILLSYGTSLWGNARLSSEMWYVHNRDSVRASVYLYEHYVETGEPAVAEKLNELFIENHPGNPLFSLQALGVCDATTSEYNSKIERAISDLKTVSVISVNHTRIIEELAARASDSNCEHLEISQIERLINAVGTSPEQLVHQSAKADLLFARAQIADQRGEYDLAVTALKASMEVKPTLDAALLIAYFLVEGGNLRLAMEYLDAQIKNPPVDGYIDKLVWRERLGRLRESLSR